LKWSFVNPGPNEDLSEREKKLSIAAFPPLGILYLATILREKGVEVSVMDQPAKGLTNEEVVKWVEKEEPDVLGFSTFASSGRTAAMISRKVKEKNQNVTIVFGGYYATFNADRVLRKYPYVDIIVRGEGEAAVVGLDDWLRGKSRLKDVRGLTFRSRDDAIVSTPDSLLIRDLDSLPFPDRSLLDVEYHSMIGGAEIATKKFTSIVSSRGCVHRCRFCSCQKFARNVWRPRSVENTLNELHYLASEGYEQFIFVDDCFTLNRTRVIELCRRMRKERLNFEWFCEGRVDNCSIEMLQEVAKAGCKVMYFGIESANQRILDYYQKDITPEQSRRAVASARKAGIDIIIGSFVLGGPDETREEIQNTLRLAKQISIDLPQINVLGAYPGMDLWDELEMRGLLNVDEFWETGALIPEICPDAVPLPEIKWMIHSAFYDFVLRPKFILLQMARAFYSQYRMGILVNNLPRINSIRESVRNIV